jgi:hypothetical protein
MIIPGGLSIAHLERLLRVAEGLPFTVYDYLPNYVNVHEKPAKYTGSKKYSTEYKWQVWKDRDLIDYKLLMTVDRWEKYWYQSRMLEKGYKYVAHGPDYPVELYPGSPSNPQEDMKKLISEAPYPPKFHGEFAQNELIRLGRVDLRDILSVTEDNAQGYVTYKINWRTYWKSKTPFLIEGTADYEIGETRGIEKQSILSQDDDGIWHVYKIWDGKPRRRK